LYNERNLNNSEASEGEVISLLKKNYVQSADKIFLNLKNQEHFYKIMILID
jgi:hypothetical protein